MEQNCSNGRSMNNTQQYNFLKQVLYIVCLFISIVTNAQTFVNIDQYNKNSEAKVSVKDNLINVSWPSGNNTIQ